jgi:ribosomal protein S18 acetylase RimI-like enzyme
MLFALVLSRVLTRCPEAEAAMSRELTGEIGPYASAFLELEGEASDPYNSFVYENKAQAIEIRRFLFESSLCEFSPPYARILLEDGRVLGMLACLTGNDLLRVRLKGALALSKAGVFTQSSALQQRMHLAGQTLIKPLAGDYYLSRIAVARAERGRGIGGFLMEQFEFKGRNLGCWRLTLEVAAHDEQAVGFYVQQGFSKMDLQRAFDTQTGRLLEYLQMAKLLT